LIRIKFRKTGYDFARRRTAGGKDDDGPMTELSMDRNEHGPK
jgi:hypothetical protein